MRATLYEALAIPHTASEDEVRAALRRQIRKYYAKTRDGHGNVEEALRFINHASRILSDPELRAQYDHDLVVSDSSVEDRIAHVVNTAVAIPGRESTAAQRTSVVATGVEPRGKRTPLATQEAQRNLHHPGLTERVAPLRHSTLVTVSLCILFGAFIAVAIALVTPADAVQAAKQVLIWLTLSLLALTVVYGVVHSIAWTQRRNTPPPPALLPPAELAILNWRRQKSVFLGTAQPQEDSSWVFQLRMAELERAKLGRTSEPRPWNRLGARLFDYALWGLLLAVPLSELRSTGIVSSTLAYWLSHPFIAPVLITATWIPVEAILVATVQTTPGKWLFGVYLQFSISDAYARRDSWTQWKRASRRAVRVWWEGVGFGFPFLAPILIAVAYEKVAEYQETPWDFAEDCLVTHGPTGSLNAVTGIAGLAAMCWLYGVAWHQVMGESIAWTRSAITAALPSSASSLSLPTMPSSPSTLWRSAFPESDTPPGAATAVVPAPPPPVRVASPAPRTFPNGTSGNADAPIDPEVAALFAARNKRLAQVSSEGPRLLEARNYRQAAEMCRAWANLELGNAKAWRCLGNALQGEGNHREAVSAFRKAKQYDPSDKSIDAAINRSQRGIVAEFLSSRGQ